MFFKVQRQLNRVPKLRDTEGHGGKTESQWRAREGMGLERLDGLYEAQLGGEPKGYGVSLPRVPKELAGGW